MYTHSDDAGQIIHDMDRSVTIVGSPTLIDRSFQNYRMLRSFNTDKDRHFQKYIPHQIEKISDEELRITFFEKAYSLRYVYDNFDQRFDQPHVNWVLSRILELSGWLNQIGKVHCGLNLDSLYIIPRNHGLVCISFYHMKNINEQLTTVSGKFINMYPSFNIVKKIATPNMDVSCAKKIAMMLMGDKTMIGDVLMNDVHVNNDLIKFLKYESDDVIETYKAYRYILTNIYDTGRFHEMVINEQKELNVKN